MPRMVRGTAVSVLGMLMALTSVSAGCAETEQDTGSGGSACALRFNYDDRTYADAGSTTRPAGPALGKVTILGCGDTSGPSNPAASAYEIHEVPGYSPRWVVMGDEGDGKLRLFKAESDQLPDRVQDLK